MEMEMKTKEISMSLWLLTSVTAIASVYFDVRMIVVVALIFLVGSYISGKEAISNEWDRRRIRWPVDDSVQSAITYQSIYFGLAALVALSTIIMWNDINRTASLFLFLYSSHASWSHGVRARVYIERVFDLLEEEHGSSQNEQ